MLLMFTDPHNKFLEGNMSTGDPPAYVLLDRDLLRRLMKRTGDGRMVTVRALAEAAGCSHATIGHLLTGRQLSVSLAHAVGIAERIGVDLLVLFTPTGRTVPAPRAELALAEAVPA